MSLAHFDGPELSYRLETGALVDALRRGFMRDGFVPVRQRLDSSEGREMLIMPALAQDFSGVKVLTVIPENAHRGMPTIQGIYTLFDFRTGRPLATMDADELTGRRTAAVSALAANALAKHGASQLLLIGSGHLIGFLAEAHTKVRAYSKISLWARDFERAKLAAAATARLGLEVHVTQDLRAAIEAADVICSATRANTPIIKGEWLQPGVHLDLVGGYRPDMREADDAVMQMATIYVDTRAGSLVEAGDLTDPISRGIISPEDIIGDIRDLSNGAGRRSAEQITVFKAVGTAAADLIAAELAWKFVA